MKTLVTGGAGFIGSHLVELLIEKGHEVLVIDNLLSGRMENLEKVQNHPKFSFYEKDIREKKEIFPFFKEIDWVFHLAALADIVPSIEDPKKYFDANVNGTFNVLECAKKEKVKKIIYAASSSCYGIAKEYPTKETANISPEYPYALTKYLAERLVMHWSRVYNLKAISLRLFNVYGKRARTTGSYGAVFGVFLTQKLNKKPFTVVGDGKQTRDFTYVEDVVKAFLKAAESEIFSEIFNVGSGFTYSVNYLVKLLKGDVTYIPKRPKEPDCTFADISKIKKKLQWKAKISFEEGVKKLLEKKSLEGFKEAPLWDEKSIEKATKKWFQYLK